MFVDGSQLQSDHVFGLAIFHCTLQGVFMSMICIALTSRPGDSIWLKLYIVAINLIALIQTIAHVVQGFSDIKERPTYHWLEVLIPRLTTALSASAQLFFIHRCWRIFQKKWLPMIPFAALFIAAFISGVGLGIYAYSTSSVPANELARVKVHLTIWIFCSFTLDLMMTGTTVTYLWRTRTGLKEHSNVFVTIWVILWTSAAPPLILMTIGIIEGYMTKTSSHPGLIIAVDITGKFFVLSVMINICGRNVIQEKLGQMVRAQSAESRRPSGLGTTTIPVIIRPEKTTEFELDEWPITTSSPRTNTDFWRAESRFEESEAKESSNEPVGEVYPAHVKQPNLFISEEQRLSREQHLGSPV